MRAAGYLLACVLTALLAGCDPIRGVIAPEPAPPARPDPRAVVEAFTRLNHAFQEQYERILDERGVRSYQVRRDDAYDALHAGFVRLGMIVESRDPEAGTLTVAAPAPRPLDAAEWRRAAETDMPMMRAILCPVLGEQTCQAVRFEPDDYVIVINAAVVAGDKGGSEVSLTTRMREIKPSQTGLPRREYPPPTAVRTALDKIWAQFEQQLRAAKKLQ